MKTGPLNSTHPHPGGNDCGTDSARRPSTVIDTIGLTFVQAATRVAELIKEHDGLDDREDEEADEVRAALYASWQDLQRVILAAEPQTLDDAVAVIDRLLCERSGMPAGSSPLHAQAIERVRAVIQRARNAESSAIEAAAFGDTIAAFAGEAEADLCAPSAPTVSMIEAGAAAAGIAPDEARAAYVAMTKAFRKEAA
ncbi:hypothetical protein [Azospirillum rugosum]|uniref:Uncharacterized protein n=1 Tax=Azospirillum rugosum TaxID=416170 RepID=A0ABS4SEQ5_9PROT|nr:hypothetical protein [Azospirillum rugosum]MBP2291062.1 hypothetical protein [Azospirillum rugosum]MDQ0524874.1 hypothetical protein [Azospirillum rugosum]